ncbi:hypothetical protein AUR04nite_00110 [Glutamicibacter uratoxydans]|uniref:Uncharacterized protein n=1 Tax=Glutamicibacter uratoxydans TaxID=43667 RepID=A0A4Y4DGY3_GLUUR|nr:hypothetical protein [Glutamicibacter uratoxydans]GED04479.1 hypothetical protein AUR04nite_00110 [Glutamicibacter uratoxydans]
MSEAIKIDETTGLPELPEGHFWNVLEGHYNVGLEIRKHRKRFGSKVIISGVVRRIRDDGEEFYLSTAVDGVSDEDFTPEAIFYSAKLLLNEWRKRDATILRYEENKKLLGAYPPKKLEVK